MKRDFPHQAEIEALSLFLLDTAPPEGAPPPPAPLGPLRAEAEEVLKRLAEPVRLMIAGEIGSGKSTLANLLIGQALVPTGVLAKPLPPLVVRHGSRLTSAAAHWGGPVPEGRIGADFAALAAEGPDYILLTLTAPLLEQITIIDTPGTADPSQERDALLALSGEAEVVLWCTNAVQAWRESERHVWSQLAPAARAEGLLVVTHMDLPAARQGYGKLMARLAVEAGRLFHAILPLDAPGAAEAAPGGTLRNAALWQKAGGEALLNAVYARASHMRRGARGEAQALLRGAIAAWQAQSPAPAPAATEKVAAKAQVPEDVAAEPMPPPREAPVASAKAKLNPMARLAKLRAPPAAPPPAESDSPPAPAAPPLKLQNKVPASPAPLQGAALLFDEKLAALAATLAAAPAPEVFLQEMAEALLALHAALDGQPDLAALFQEALDLTVLMQMENAPDALAEGALLLLQLARALAAQQAPTAALAATA